MKHIRTALMIALFTGCGVTEDAPVPEPQPETFTRTTVTTADGEPGVEEEEGVTRVDSPADTSKGDDLHLPRPCSAVGLRMFDRPLDASGMPTGNELCVTRLDTDLSKLCRQYVTTPFGRYCRARWAGAVRSYRPGERDGLFPVIGYPDRRGGEPFSAWAGFTNAGVHAQAAERVILH